jgi:hypothetical protein
LFITNQANCKASEASGVRLRLERIDGKRSKDALMTDSKSWILMFQTPRSVPKIAGVKMRVINEIIYLLVVLMLVLELELELVLDRRTRLFFWELILL